jgi:hypothetical protein
MQKLKNCCLKKKTATELKRADRQKYVELKLKTITWQEMQRIPAGEEDLIDVAIYMNMLETKPVDFLQPTEIKSPALRMIYQG